MKVIAIIPARMGSSRFPGKPLAPILGRPMIEHVYRRTALGKCLDGVYVATCDDAIRDAAEGFGAEVVMTAASHQRASDRAAEAVAGLDADVVVMVQGDEPMLHPDMIDEAVAPFGDDSALQCVNLAKRIDSDQEFNDPNTIKVVTDLAGNALYMSRRPIPHNGAGRGAASGNGAGAWKQVCVMPFRRQALLRFAALPPTPLEIAESVDMNRFLEHGVPVRMVETRFRTHAVDTPADLALVEGWMRDDPLTAAY